MVLVRFMANYMFGGRCAEPPVICVEVGTQVDLLAHDEKMVEELVDDLNSGCCNRSWWRWPVSLGVSQESMKKENLEMWVHRAQHAHVDLVKRRGSWRC